MAIYQYTLDTTVVTDPVGWNNFQYSFSRFLDTRGVSTIMPTGSLRFVEDGFTYLDTAFKADGVCGYVDFKLEYKEWSGGTFATLFTGRIRLSDIEFDLENNFATVADVVDGSYVSLLNANADIPATVTVPRSKNDVAITGCTAININFFNAAGAYIYLAKPMYRVFDVLEFMVAFCSDGNLQFASTIFDLGGTNEGAFISYGSAINSGVDTPIVITWADLIKELYVKYNVVPIVDETTAPVTIRMESAADTFETTVSTIFSGGDIRKLKKRSIPFVASPTVYNGDKPLSSFTTIKFGGGATFNPGTYPDIRFKSWDTETYLILGDCGFKAEFDLSGTWNVGSNVIETILAAGVATWDEDIFLVETDYNTFNRATRYDVININPGPYTYNDIFTNQYISSLFLGGIPNSIAAYLGDGNDGFQAEKTVLSSSAAGVMDLNPAQFIDDFTPPNNDPNGNYSVATFRYTVPSNGLYVFQAIVEYLNVVTLPVAAPSFDSTVTIRRYDSFGTLLESYSTVQTISSDTTHSVAAPGFYANATDYFDVRVQGLTNGPGPGVASWDVQTAYFLTNSVDNSGGIYQVVDPATFRGNYYLFQVPMTFADYITMAAYPQRNEAVFVNRGGFPNDITGFLISADYNLGSGLATIELVSDS